MTIWNMELLGFQSALIMTTEALGHRIQETGPWISVLHNTSSRQAHWKVGGHHGHLRIW